MTSRKTGQHHTYYGAKYSANTFFFNFFGLGCDINQLVTIEEHPLLAQVPFTALSATLHT